MSHSWATLRTTSSSSRLIRGNKIQKQSLGLYASNFLVRMDTDVSVLHYPQRPVVKSFMHDVTDYEKHPAGQNITIALMSYEGYNMEDAIIINKGSIQRGLARSTYFRPYVAEELRYSGGQVDEITIPDKEVKGYKSEHDYRYLEKDGVVYTGATVGEGDVIMGKTSPPRFLSSLDEYSLASSTRRESSISLKHGERGIVETLDIIISDEMGERPYEMYSGGEAFQKISCKNQQKYGLFQQFYPNGVLWIEEDYREGLVNGISRTFDRNGNLQKYAKYESGSIVEIKEYDKNGNELGQDQAWAEVFNNKEVISEVSRVSVRPVNNIVGNEFWK